MENDIKCPLCGAQLKEGKDCFISCFETDCQCCDGFRKNVYQALISGKKAQEELRVYKKAYDILDTSILELLPQLNHLVCSGFLQARRQKTKDCIASITKGDKE